MKIVFDTVEDQRRAAAPFITALTWLLAPVVAAGSLLTSGDWGGPTLAACGFAGAATAISIVLRDRRIARCLRGVILMSQISLLVANGDEWQIDLHMAYFAALAVLVICADWLVILVAALTVAVHHLVLTYILPAAVFGASASLGRVGLHAVIVIAEAGALIWICANLGNIFNVSRRALTKAEEFGANAARMNGLAEAARRAQPCLRKCQSLVLRQTKPLPHWPYLRP